MRRIKSHNKGSTTSAIEIFHTCKVVMGREGDKPYFLVQSLEGFILGRYDYVTDALEEAEAHDREPSKKRSEIGSWK